MPGKLYIVATPIGNLEDITYRAIRILSEVDLIAAEDTRHSLKLLNHYKISKPLTSYYEHNKQEKGKYLVNKLLSGVNIALVSDAGSPGISDPGEDLIREAIENNIEVTSIPGPCAMINAAIISGLSTSKLCFEGFLSKNKSHRRARIKEISSEKRTIILYESPHGLLKTLKDLREHFGDRKISIAREMTKKFEEVFRTTLNMAIEKYDIDVPRGEFVLIIEGSSKENVEISQFYQNISIIDHIQRYVSEGFEKKDAIKMVAKDRNISKREVYNVDIMDK